MNSTGRLSNKGSTDAQDYASKRKQQMDKAKQIREERKNGVGSSASSNVFQSVGQSSLHGGNSKTRSSQHTSLSNTNAQDTTTASMLSSPSIHGGRMNSEPFMNGGQMPSQAMQYQRQSQYSQMPLSQAAYNNGVYTQGVFQTPNQIFPVENGFLPRQFDAFSTPLNGGGGIGNFGAPPMIGHISQNFGTPNMVSDGFLRNSNSNFNPPLEGVIINSRTQDNYYHNQQNGMARNHSHNLYNQPGQMFSPGSNSGQLPPRQQNMGGHTGFMNHQNSMSPGPTYSGLQTISHDGIGYRQQTQIGFNQQPQSMQTQQDFGAHRSGQLTPNQQTNYSQRDVEEARGSLTLLKKRISNSRDRGQQKNQTIDYSVQNTSHARNGSKGVGNSIDNIQVGNDSGMVRSQRNSSFQNAQNVVENRMQNQNNVPPRAPRVNQSQNYNDGGLSTTDTKSTPGDNQSNYRKVFKPNIPPPRSELAVQDNDDDSVERMNSMALGLTPSTMKRQASNRLEPSSQNKPRAVPQTYQRDQKVTVQNGQTENQVLQSSPQKRGRAGLPPTNPPSNRPQPQAMGRQQNGRMSQHQPPDPSSYEEQMPSNPGIYNFDEEMPNPFGSKKAAVMNTPPKNNPKTSMMGRQVQQVSNQPNEYAELEQNDQLIQCSTCDRRFNEKALQRHSNICVKVFQTKRDAFNIAEQRKPVDGTGKGIEDVVNGGRGVKNYKPKLPAKKGPAQGSQPSTTYENSGAEGGGAPKKMPKWKQQSLQFRQAVGPAQSKGGNGGGASNFNPTYNASEDLDDRITCQFCGRKFNEQAGLRHIPHCETKYKAAEMKKGPPRASGAVNKRNPSVGNKKW